MSSVDRVVRRNKGKTNVRAKGETPLVCTIVEIGQLLRVGRAAAYAVAREIGRRVGGKRRGRLIVSRDALQAWLRGEVSQ